jgi:pyruvate-ferredoxin/flavodoxin oxidoreductase
MLVRITQQDVVYRRYLDPGHRAFIPDFGVYITWEENGKVEYRALSRQLVMFCVERRKAWRMLQSKAGIVNKEYAAQKAILADVDAGKIPLDEFLTHAHEILGTLATPTIERIINTPVETFSIHLLVAVRIGL